jgi:plasmid maintenance system killer protein
VKYYFSNKKLEQLYTTGKNSKYKLDKNVIRDFIWLVGVIDATKDTYDFWNQPALNFEKLEGFSKRFSLE